MDEYRFADDVVLVKELLGIDYRDLAEAIGVDPVTISRWKRKEGFPSQENLLAFYDYAFEKGVRLNEIKAQLHREQLESQGLVTLFHGAKKPIEGPLSLSHSRAENDFGRGFYCGETLAQSAMFVSGYANSSIYLYGFDPRGLKRRTYHVDPDWMIAIAWFRGKIPEYADHERIRRLREGLAGVDYLVAPIADNRMFEILNQFIDGEITDVQCQHCLSATNLGSQYVLVSERALARMRLQERCFLAGAEKRAFLASRKKEAAVGADKVKVARRRFRGQGKYIDEVLS